MQKLSSQAILLGVKPFGESQSLVKLFSAKVGLLSGMTRLSKNQRPQIGALLEAFWQARLEEHLGTVKLELHEAQIISPMDLQPLPMHALMCIANLLITVLPERQPEELFYKHTLMTLAKLSNDHWLADYIIWEKALLDILGVGLDLNRCASGIDCSPEELIYISPKTGRAVSAQSGAPYADKLWALPQCLKAPILKEPHKEKSQNTSCPAVSMADYCQGLHITGAFILRSDLMRHDELPDIRQKLAEKIQEMS